MPGDLDVLMAEKLLENLETHAGIEKLRGEGVAKAVNGMSLMLQSRLLDVVEEPAPGGAVTEGTMALSVEEVGLVLVPYRGASASGRRGVVAEIDHPAHIVLLSLHEGDLPLGQIDIVEGEARGPRRSLRLSSREEGTSARSLVSSMTRMSW